MAASDIQGKETVITAVEIWDRTTGTATAEILEDGDGGDRDTGR